MKVKINGEFQDMSFWSFFKGYIISHILLIMALGLIFSIIGVIIS